MSRDPDKQRRRLFQRLESNLPPLEITKRDLAILELVGEYRFLNTEQIHALVGGSKHNVTERLSRLFHHAYLDRPPHQRELRSEGYRHIVYALAPKGLRLLASSEGEVGRTASRLAATNQSARRYYMAHTLMVSQFRVCLTLACRANGHIHVRDWGVPHAPLCKVLVGRRRVAVIPDAHFTLEAKDGYIAHFFLEADRGTMSHRRFLSKLQAYWGMRTSAGDRGVPTAFRVLVVASSRRRMENLLATAVDADPRHAGSRMFCFTSELDYDLERPGSLLGSIWRTPADAPPRSVVDRQGSRNG